MTKSNYVSKAAQVEKHRVALTNAKTNPRILEMLNQYGVSNEVLDQGSSLLKTAREAFSNADLARVRRTESYKVFSQKLIELEERFISHRKKAQIAYLNDKIAKEKLELSSRYPRTYLELLPMIRSFYTNLSEDQALLEPLANFGLNADEVSGMLEAATELEMVRANYINEKGVSQDATNAKNEAMQSLNLWMSRFFVLAKDALKQQPQLLESLDKVVKN